MCPTHTYKKNNFKDICDIMLKKIIDRGYNKADNISKTFDRDSKDLLI